MTKIKKDWTLKKIIKKAADVNLNTALALSKSLEDEKKVKRRKAKELNTIPLHLMLEPHIVKDILDTRLSNIISQAFEFHKFIPRRQKESINWDKSSLYNDISAANLSINEINVSEQLSFYVDALMPLITPTNVRVGDKIFNMSQIPGRERSRRFNDKCDETNGDISRVSLIKNIVEDTNVIPECDNMKVVDDKIEIHECSYLSSVKNKSMILHNENYTNEVHEVSHNTININQATQEIKESRFLSMFNNYKYSDLLILLKSGDILNLHKFVLAAWQCDDDVIKDDQYFLPLIEDETVLRLFKYLYSDGAILIDDITENNDYVDLCKKFGINYSIIMKLHLKQTLHNHGEISHSKNFHILTHNINISRSISPIRSSNSDPQGKDSNLSSDIYHSTPYCQKIEDNGLFLVKSSPTPLPSEHNLSDNDLFSSFSQDLSLSLCDSISINNDKPEDTNVVGDTASAENFIDNLISNSVTPPKAPLSSISVNNKLISDEPNLNFHDFSKVRSGLTSPSNLNKISDPSFINHSLNSPNENLFKKSKINASNNESFLKTPLPLAERMKMIRDHVDNFEKVNLRKSISDRVINGNKRVSLLDSNYEDKFKEKITHEQINEYTFPSYQPSEYNPESTYHLTIDYLTSPNKESIKDCEFNNKEKIFVYLSSDDDLKKDNFKKVKLRKSLSDTIINPRKRNTPSNLKYENEFKEKKPRIFTEEVIEDCIKFSYETLNFNTVNIPVFDYSTTEDISPNNEGSLELESVTTSPLPLSQRMNLNMKNAIIINLLNDDPTQTTNKRKSILPKITNTKEPLKRLPKDLKERASTIILNTKTEKKKQTKKCKNKVQFETPPRQKMEINPFTPMPDYLNMATPEMQRKYIQYGVKKGLSKKKSILILQECHRQTHRIDCESDSESSSSSSSDTSEAVNNIPTQTNDNNDDSNDYENFLLFMKVNYFLEILTYKPLNATKIMTEMKALNIKQPAKKIFDYFDNQSIAYFTNANGNKFHKPKKSKFVI